MATTTALNLEAICRAIDQHNGGCSFPAIEIRLCLFEYERLDFPEIKGIPLKVDETLGSGRFRVVCSGDHDNLPALVETVELVA